MDGLDEVILNILLPKIVSKIDDPVQRLKLTIISKDWKKKIIECGNLKSLCLEKIGSLSFDAIIKSTLSHVLFNDYNDITQEDWYHVFLSYIKWQTFYDSSIDIKKSLFTDVMLSGLLTNLSINGKHLIAGEYYGKCEISISHIPDLREISKIKIENKRIRLQKVTFWRSKPGRLIYVIESRDPNIPVVEYNFQNLPIVITPLISCSGTNGYLYVYFASRRDIKIYSDLLISDEVTYDTGESTLSDLIDAEWEVIDMCSFMSKISILAYHSDIAEYIYDRTVYIKLVTIKDRIDSEHENRHILGSSEMINWTIDSSFSSSTGNYLITPNNIVIYISTRSFAFFTNFYGSTQSTYHSSTVFTKRNIHSVLLHGNNLIFGVNYGTIYLFYIQDLKKLASQHLFDDITKKVINLYTQRSIYSLSTCEIDSEPIIIASDGNKIFKIMQNKNQTTLLSSLYQGYQWCIII